ncbi:MAG: hypothetical protein ACJ790_23280 [Myxococcaceae bacterium]
MSRIEGSSSNVPVEHHEEPEVAEKKPDEPIRTSVTPRAIAVERYNAHKNDATQSKSSRTEEGILKYTLSAMNPGDKIRVSGEMEGGELGKVGANASFEIEKLKEGYRMTVLAGGSVGVGKELGHAVEAKLGIKGAVSASWDYATPDLAADSAVALSEKLNSANPFVTSNPENDEQVRRMFSNPSAITFEVGTEAELSADVGMAEAGVSSGGKTRMTYDFFNKKATSEVALESNAHGTYGVGGEAGGATVFCRGEMGKLESKLTLKSEYTINPRAWDKLQHDKDYAAFTAMVLGAPRQNTLVQEASAQLGPYGAEMKKQIPMNSLSDLKKVGDPFSIEGAWFEKTPRSETGFEVDVGVAKGGMKFEYDPAPTNKHEGSVKDLFESFKQRTDAENAVRSKQFIHSAN